MNIKSTRQQDGTREMPDPVDGESDDGGSDDDSDDDGGNDDSDTVGLTTAEYLRLTVLNRVSIVGLVIALVGAIAVMATSPTGPVLIRSPLLSGGLLLVGVLVFAVGFSLGQRALGDREDW